MYNAFQFSICKSEKAGEKQKKLYKKKKEKKFNKKKFEVIFDYLQITMYKFSYYF